MRACVLAGGTLGDTIRVSARLPEPDYVICADDGLTHAVTLGLIPDRVVGDFDSVSEAIVDQYRHSQTVFDQYPSRKDKTDTQIAVDTVLDMGADEVWIVAGAGTRLDHSCANLMLLFRIAEKGAGAYLINQYNLIFPILTESHIQGDPGQVISFLPFGGDALVDVSEGLSYPLDGLHLPATEPIGISNVMTDASAYVRVKKGRLLCMMAWDK